MTPRVLAVCAIAVCLAASAGVADPVAGGATAVSPEQALAELRQGNARFRSGAAERPHQNAARRAETVTHGQHPIAVVLSCADSRVPPEIVFDQGIGDLFSIRIAGNPAGVHELATIEYGAAHLGAPVCVVLGHSGCGAVGAALDGGHLEGNLPALIRNVTPAVTRARQAAPGCTGEPLHRAAVEANVWLAIETLFQRSDVLRELVSKNKLRVVGAIYDLASGEVHWLGAHAEEKRLLAGTGTK